MLSRRHLRARASYLTQILVLLIPLLCCKFTWADHSPWRIPLPQRLSDQNTKVSFEVDSTWHLVKGETSGITGDLWLANPRDQLSVRAKLQIPVARFNTHGESRDERMREVMDSERSPNVIILIDSVSPQCSVDVFRNGGECKAILQARIKIRGHERVMELHGALNRNSKQMTLSGKAVFGWAEFGVEDPSILVAKLDPNVKVSFLVSLPVN